MFDNQGKREVTMTGSGGMKRAIRQKNSPELVGAAEIACFAYCPEQWRLEYGLGLKPGNQAALTE